MSQKSKWDYLKAIYSRYQKVSKPLRARILDEFCQVCGYNRKYAIRLLNGPTPQKPKTKPKGRRPTYGLKVILSLTAIWEAAGYPCSARLKALLPLWLPWAQKRFAISAQAQKQLLSITPPPRPAAQAQKTPTQKQTLRTHQTRHSAQTSHPHQNRLLGCKNPRLYRNRSGLALGQLCFGGVHSLAQCYRHPLHLGRKPRRNGQKPDCCSQCHARD